MFKILTGRRYLVTCATKGTFYMDVKETGKNWTKGKLIRRKADKPKGTWIVYDKELAIIKNSSHKFILIENKTVSSEQERKSRMGLKCFYELGSTGLTTSIDELVQVKEGFFIDVNYEFTEKESEALCWIPPSAIRQVYIDHKKEETEKTERVL